jgi:hypothetical protein
MNTYWVEFKQRRKSFTRGFPPIPVENVVCYKYVFSGISEESVREEFEENVNNFDISVKLLQEPFVIGIEEKVLAGKREF